MPESPSTRLVWHRLEAVDYMLSDLVDALVLLHNVGVIEEDELKRLVEKAAKMFPLRATEEEIAAERAAEQAGDWTVLTTVDVDGHLTVNAHHADGSEVVDISDEYGDDGFKARLTTHKIEDDYRAAKRDGDWVREDFDPHSELTKERDGYRADAEAERRRQDLWGY
jgi:hypothetical protein